MKYRIASEYRTGPRKGVRIISSYTMGKAEADETAVVLNRGWCGKKKHWVVPETEGGAG